MARKKNKKMKSTKSIAIKKSKAIKSKKRISGTVIGQIKMGDFSICLFVPDGKSPHDAINFIYNSPDVLPTRLQKQQFEISYEDNQKIISLYGPVCPCYDERLNRLSAEMVFHTNPMVREYFQDLYPEAMPEPAT